MTDVAAALASPYYGFVFLGLANAAYAAEGQPNQILNAVYQTITNPTYMPPLPAPDQAGVENPTPIAGTWSLDWGPANRLKPGAAGDNSNLVYIASFQAQNSTKPLFYVVGVRGTDTSSGFEGLVNQLAQDMRDFTLRNWPDVLSGKAAGVDHTPPAPANPVYPPSQSGRIAHGTAEGFVKVASFVAPLNNGKPPNGNFTDGLPLAVALSKLLNGQTDIPVVVTGHSLGACLTQTVAAYLDWYFGGAVQVIPHMYAPPTAGDGAFSTYYKSVFSRGTSWVNSLDVVPYAYTTISEGTKQILGLQWAKANLWKNYNWADTNQPGPDLPAVMTGAIDVLAPVLPHGVFARPPAQEFDMAGTIPGHINIAEMLAGHGEDPNKAGTGLSQLMWQHFPPAYIILMQRDHGQELVPYTFSNYAPPKP